MLACIDTEWKLLTWVRYTIWIPLYPMGVVAEGRFALRPLLISCYMLVIKKNIYIYLNPIITDLYLFRCSLRQWRRK